MLLIRPIVVSESTTVSCTADMIVTRVILTADFSSPAESSPHPVITKFATTISRMEIIFVINLNIVIIFYQIY